METRKKLEAVCESRGCHDKEKRICTCVRRGCDVRAVIKEATSKPEIEKQN